MGWERIVGARRRVESLLSDLPPGFLAYRDVELARSSQQPVDHLVIGPRTIATVTTHVVDDSVAWGSGRTADTLFAGRHSLRPVLDGAAWAADELSERLGRVVEPILVLVAPELPAATFDVHGVRVCEPRTLLRQIASTTPDFVDVTAVGRLVEQHLGARPAVAVAFPSLGTPAPPPQLTRRGSAPVRRSAGARWHALTRRPVVRMVAAAILIAAIVATWSALRSGAASLADEGVAIVDDALGAAPVSTPTDPASVITTVSCPEAGGGWQLRLAWPGPPPSGVAGYSVATRVGRGAPVLHPPSPWTGPEVAPVTMRIDEPVVVVTEHHAPDGTVVATATETVTPPDAAC